MHKLIRGCVHSKKNIKFYLQGAQGFIKSIYVLCVCQFADSPRGCCSFSDLAHVPFTLPARIKHDRVDDFSVSTSKAFTIMQIMCCFSCGYTEIQKRKADEYRLIYIGMKVLENQGRVKDKMSYYSL